MDDDDLPVTETWLRNSADDAAGEGETFCAEWFDHSNPRLLTAALSIERRGSWYSAVIDREHDWPRTIETRGDVRRLLAALNVVPAGQKVG